jgi:hypothetical protein
MSSLFAPAILSFADSFKLNELEDIASQAKKAVLHNQANERQVTKLLQKRLLYKVYFFNYMLQVCGPDLFTYMKDNWTTKGSNLFTKVISALFLNLDSLKEKTANKALDNSLLIFTNSAPGLDTQPSFHASLAAVPNKESDRQGMKQGDE